MGSRRSQAGLTAFRACLLAAVWMLSGPLAVSWAEAACAPERVDLRGAFGAAQFTVELADTPEERATGLMHRESMPASAGMLFVYEAPTRAMFWMKNTLIPLDMIFMDATGRVTAIHSDAIPHDETPIDGGSGVFAVLEINGGMARRMGIAPGAEMRHPAFAPETAVWPCVAP